MHEVILITGGSGGIGAATAREASRRGYDVGLGYLTNAAAADEAVSAVRAAGARAVAVHADVGAETDVEQMFDTVEAALGAVTVLVNNAAILGPQMRLADIEPARWQQVFATNVLGAFLCARQFVRRATAAGRGGAIVNVSSTAARLGSPGEYIDYAASKGALETMTLGLARELAADGIRVNAVRPGIIDTQLHGRGGDPDRPRRLQSAIPMQRPGRAIEVAHAILWLASDEAAYVTGAILDVSGGR